MKYLITALCGSRLWGLDTETSDRDYIVVAAGDGAKKIPYGSIVPEKRDGVDYFLVRLDTFYEIAACASPMVAPSYDAVVASEAPLLREFWKRYPAQLADIYPYATYQIALEQVENHLDAGRERCYAACARLLGLICGRYETGDMLAARQLPQVWRERYFAAKAGDVTGADVAAWLQSCKTASYRDYYETQWANRALYDQYRHIIDKTISTFGSDAEKQEANRLYIVEGSNAMIGKLLPVIRDSADYITALSLFKADAPLNTEDAGKLVGIYQQYGESVEDSALAKLYLALDLLPGRTAENAADFAGLELPEDDLNALFLAKDISGGELKGETADQVVETVTGGELTRPVDIILARTALDIMADSRDFGGLREQTQALAGYLASVGAEEMEKYSEIVEEARIKCRQ